MRRIVIRVALNPLSVSLNDLLGFAGYRFVVCRLDAEAFTQAHPVTQFIGLRGILRTQFSLVPVCRTQVCVGDGEVWIKFYGALEVGDLLRITVRHIALGVSLQ